MPNNEDFAELNNSKLKSLCAFKNFRKIPRGVVLLSFFVINSACANFFSASHQNTLQNQKQSALWTLSARQPYIDEIVIVEFKSGNKRKGQLKKITSEKDIALTYGANETVWYSLSEVLQILAADDGDKAIYP